MARNKNPKHERAQRREAGRAPEQIRRAGTPQEPVHTGAAASAAPSDTAEKPSGASAILAEIVQRKKARRLRLMVLIVAVLAVVFAWLTGLLSSSVAVAADLIDSARIAMMPADGYPAQTGVTELYQLEPLTGGFAELGEESCVVYTQEGTRLRNIQAGYARPALAAGSTRFVLYNRGGTELRVESRTRTLYTQTMGGSLLLCAMAQNGTLAAAAEDPNYLAKLTVYSAAMDEQMTWGMTETEGTPLRMAFSDDSRRLAVATLSARGGQLLSNLYVLDLAGRQEKQLAAVTGQAPLALEWADGANLLAVYDSSVQLLAAKDGTQKAVYDLGGQTLVDYAWRGGTLALLLANGTSEQLVLLDDGLTVISSGAVVSADHVALSKTAVYTCTSDAVECYSLTGEYQWKREYADPPQAVFDARQLLVFTGDRIEVCPVPDSKSTS